MKNLFITTIILAVFLPCMTASVVPLKTIGLTGHGFVLNARTSPVGNNLLFPGNRMDSDQLNFGQPGRIHAGINIHFVKGHDKDLDMIAEAGFRFIRTDLVWENTEHIRGVYDWSAYDELTGNLRKRGLRAMYILDYSNPLYEEIVEFVHQDTGVKGMGTAAPQHSKSIESYARWAAAAADHFRGPDIIWEIWNEPNVTHFWRPVPDVAKYTKLAITAARAIRRKVPDARIIGPAASQIPFPFLESFISSGVLEYLDGISIHPYRDYALAPESAGADYRKLRSLIGQYAPEEKKDLPVICSEWGYASATNGVSPGKQAEYIVRMQLTNLYYGIPLSVWYDWKNDGDDPSNFEHNCGTVTSTLQPKPAYTAIRTMNRQLEGFTLSKRIDTGNDADYVLLFENDRGERKICAWTTEGPHKVKLKEKVSGFTKTRVVDGMGMDGVPEKALNGLQINVETLPVYISFVE